MNDSKMHHETQTGRPVLPLVWRLVLITAGTILIWDGVPRLTTALWGPEAPPLQSHIINAIGIGVLATCLVLVLRRYVDRRPMSTLGLSGGKLAVRDFLYGALTWLIPAAVGLTAVLALGWLEISINTPTIELIGAILMLIALVFVYEAFPEELIFRGYIYRNLTDAVTPWIGVLLQALLFTAFGTALWIIGEGWGVFLERSIFFFAMGFVIGGVRVLSGSVWAGMGFHVAFQVAMQLSLSSRHTDITISDENVFTLVTGGSAFLAAIVVAHLLWRGKTDRAGHKPAI